MSIISPVETAGSVCKSQWKHTHTEASSDQGAQTYGVSKENTRISQWVPTIQNKLQSDYGSYNVTEPPIDAPRDPLYKTEREILKTQTSALMNWCTSSRSERCGYILRLKVNWQLEGFFDDECCRDEESCDTPFPEEICSIWSFRVLLPRIMIMLPNLGLHALIVTNPTIMYPSAIS
ncbi:hypothetical protein Fmac_001910 [Flemingia macrophylla]|uniref:Uncharacterized protein n=1 Tax=Flemingia macrophylla TaxID=520843 RepID=A0ABD1NIF2_9FABA